MTALQTPPRPTAVQDRPTSPRPTVQSLAAPAVLLGLLAASVWAFSDLKINVATFVDGAGNAARFAQRVFPLDFPPIGELLALCAQTLGIVLLATLLSALLSLPLAVLAAQPTTLGRSTRLGARGVIVVARALPDVVLAIVFVRIFGIGALTGILAMGIHSVGMIGKMYADAIEQSDPGPPTALRAAGATRLQRITGGVLPQVLPAFVAVGLHRFDINLRVSVLLGFVGVGGIGFAIAESLRVLDYQRGIALALVVLALCIAVELLSGAARTALLGREARPGRKTRTAAPSSPGRLTAAPSTDPRARSAAALATGRVSPPWTVARARRTTYALVSLALVAAAWVSADLSLPAIINALPQIATSIGQFLPPTTGGIFSVLLAALWTTVKIALAATLIAVVLSLPIGALAARNVAPSPHVARAARLVILLIRGVPELILAIVFVVITGLGEVAGAIALGVGGVGLLGKLVADSLEEVDPGPEHALRAAGGSRAQVFFAATVPGGTKALVAHVLYLLDTNIRAATLLGIVGAGGIGFYLLNASRVLEFGVVTTILLMIVAVVMAIELLSIWLRSHWH